MGFKDRFFFVKGRFSGFIVVVAMWGLVRRGERGLGKNVPIVAVVTAVVGHIFGGLIEESGGCFGPLSAFSLVRPGSIRNGARLISVSERT